MTKSKSDYDFNEGDKCNTNNGSQKTHSGFDIIIQLKKIIVVIISMLCSDSYNYIKVDE